jgi:hypothetical protein
MKRPDAMNPTGISRSMRAAPRLVTFAVLAGLFLPRAGLRPEPPCPVPVLDFAAPRSFTLDGVARAVAAADLDGDGHADLAVLGSVLPRPIVAVFLGDGRGALAGAAVVPLIEEDTIFGGPFAIAAADLDGDWAHGPGRRR